MSRLIAMKKQQVKKGKSLEGGEEPQKERRKCTQR
jgi:hypothetical protein